MPDSPPELARRLRFQRLVWSGARSPEAYGGRFTSFDPALEGPSRRIVNLLDFSPSLGHTLS